MKSANKIAITGFILVLISIAVVLAAPFGSRLEYLDYDTAVIVLKWGGYSGIVSALICIVGLFMSRPGKIYRGIILSILGLIIVIPTLIFLAYWKDVKENSPPIQDITTNTENPPQFWAAPNVRDYGDEDEVAYQKEAYPDIKPLLLNKPPDKIYDLALQVIQQKGWKIWAENREEKHLEATESTFWFGFEDDVVIHITATDSGNSRVDMRSTSRFGGGGDGGTNARRIRSFLRALKAKAGD
ncbi:MAG: DUF1499 domain-containing protein [Acidiferrobacterales bacterium]